MLPADLDGLADPLVVCWCAPMWVHEGTIPTDSVRHFTDYRAKTLNPDWGADPKELVFSISDEFWGLSVAVYDHDDHGDNDVMAYCRIGLNVVKSHGFEVTRWFTLGIPPDLLGDYQGQGKHSSRGVHFGEVKMKLEWYNKGAREWDLAHASSSTGGSDANSVRSFSSSSSSSSEEEEEEEEEEGSGVGSVSGDSDTDGV